MDITEAIADNVASHCECNFTVDSITDGMFQCFPSFPETVTYHAKLHGTLQVNVSHLVTALQGWVDSRGTIELHLALLSVVRFCTVTSISPLQHCPGDTTTPPPASTTPTTITTTVTPNRLTAATTTRPGIPL